jgi:hypothetical protein
MARGTQSGYNMGLTQGAGTGPVNPVAMPEQDTQGTAGVDQLIKTIFPISQPITSPMQGADNGLNGGPILGDPSPGKLNFGQPGTAPKINALPKPVNRPVRTFGGGSGGQNPFFK